LHHRINPFVEIEGLLGLETRAVQQIFRRSRGRWSDASMSSYYTIAGRRLTHIQAILNTPPDHLIDKAFHSRVQVLNKTNKHLHKADHFLHGNYS
jgi:hypothetical protein